MIQWTNQKTFSKIFTGIVILLLLFWYMYICYTMSFHVMYYGPRAWYKE